MSIDLHQCCGRYARPRSRREFLARAPVPLDAAMLAHVEAALPVVRRRGYAVAASGPVLLSLRQATIQPAGLPRDEAYWAAIRQRVAALTPDEVQLLDLSRADGQGVCYISAPVFSLTASSRDDR